MDGKDAAELLESADRHPAILPKFYQPQVLKRPLEEAEDDQKVKRPRETVRRHPKYRRHGKPPYTYVGMMAVAIHTSSTKRLTLVGIRESLAAMFPFFQGEYLGWRDSVRHNLSSSKCFTRIHRGVSKNIKGCFWKVDLSLVPPTAFLRATIKDPVLREQWAPTLTEQLGIPDINLAVVQTNIKSEKSESIQQVTPEVDKERLTQKTSFSIDNILGKNTKPDLICEPPDKKFDHPYSFLGHQTSITYLQGKFAQPASTYSPYAAMLYQAVNSEQGSDADSYLRPEARYSESHPFSTMTSASDLRKYPGREDQVEGQVFSRYPGNRRYTVAAEESATYLDHRQMSEHDMNQFQMEALHHQATSSMNYKQPPPSTSYLPSSSTSYLPSSSTSYLPSSSTSYLPSPSTSYLPSPSTSYLSSQQSSYPSSLQGHSKPTSSMSYTLPPPASYQQAFLSTDYNQAPPSLCDDSNRATSYETKPPSMSYNPRSTSDHQTSSSARHYDESSSMTYHQWNTEYPVPSSPTQSNRNSISIPPPRSSALPPVPTFTWATYLSNTNSNCTSSPQSLKTAFDDLAMFSDASSEVSVRPNIPLYAFIDDSQSLPDSVVPESVTSEQANPAFSPCNPDVSNNFEHLFSARNLYTQ